MIDKYSDRFLNTYRVAWAAFLVLVVVPAIGFGSYMTGMPMEEKLALYAGYVGAPLSYVYWAIGEIIPDSAYSMVLLSGLLWPEFAIYFFALLMLLVEPPFYSNLKQAKVRRTVADEIEAAS